MEILGWVGHELLLALLGMLLTAALVAALVALVFALIEQRPQPPPGPCVGGTNCRAFLPHGVSVDPKTRRYKQNQNVPPMCDNCPFVER